MTSHFAGQTVKRTQMPHGAYKLQLKYGDIEITVVGDKDFVSDKFTELNASVLKMARMTKEGLLPPPVKTDPSPPREEKEQDETPGYNNAVDVQAPSLLPSLDEFLPAKPVSNNDVVLGAAYYLVKENEAGDITSTDLREVLEKFGHTDIKNTHMCLKQNAAKGFLRREKNEEGVYIVNITDGGKRYVESGFSRP